MIFPLLLSLNFAKDCSHIFGQLPISFSQPEPKSKTYVYAKELKFDVDGSFYFYVGCKGKCKTHQNKKLTGPVKFIKKNRKTFIEMFYSYLSFKRNKPDKVYEANLINGKLYLKASYYNQVLFKDDSFLRWDGSLNSDCFDGCDDAHECVNNRCKPKSYIRSYC